MGILVWWEIKNRQFSLGNHVADLREALLAAIAEESISDSVEKLTDPCVLVTKKYQRKINCASPTTLAWLFSIVAPFVFAFIRFPMGPPELIPLRLRWGLVFSVWSSWRFSLPLWWRPPKKLPWREGAIPKRGSVLRPGTDLLSFPQSPTKILLTWFYFKQNFNASNRSVFDTSFVIMCPICFYDCSKAGLMAFLDPCKLSLLTVTIDAHLLAGFRKLTNNPPVRKLAFRLRLPLSLLYILYSFSLIGCSIDFVCHAECLLKLLS